MTNDDDPFAGFESDQTMIKPNPGARRRGGGSGGTEGPFAPGAAPASNQRAFDAAFTQSGAVNPLVAACAPLLQLAPRIRTMSACADPAALRDALAAGVRRFETEARAGGIATEQVTAARYMVCTMLDEAASGTPWGAGVWARQSLLVTFHNEAWGGEKVFQLLARLAQKPAQHLHLLELASMVLALGFEGRYRVAAQGAQTLDAIRTRLYQLIRKERGEPERALSPHWQGVPTARRRTTDVLPVWVVGAFALLLLVAAWLAMSFQLGRLSDPPFDTLASIRAGAQRPLVVTQAARPRLAEFLAQDIRDGLVAVDDRVDRSVVTLHGDNVFSPGSADVSAQTRPLIGRIAAALGAVPGNVLVTGHTDDRPIRSGRFPSNWELSQERAANVRDLLAATVPPARLKAEGKGDADPVAPNDSPAGRARNRRVEVTLFAKPGS
ncbi:DotU family type IV/VI secretion system protein [Caballeronia pedi]|uniref:DotU family type IV/VI secretion system protein n=1 Tax=Caballeronia pedi TaxID=1777141 RepID=A0A158D5L4_9BURK|nr:DotU family type VI secretion system protein [Caballeronia pedi]SAK89935.1 DotU family type IV/VI secretion system protein [Caballeronia pedi]